MNRQFGATSTTDEVLEGVDLSGKRILVTGVSAGLGVETARALAAHGAQVVGAARDLAKAKARPRRSAPTPRTAAGWSWSSSTSPRSPACAPAPTRCVAAGKPFDLVIANAGVMACPVRQDRRRLRDPVRHQPPRPFRAGQPDRRAAEAGRAAGEPVLGRPSLLRRRSRRSELRAHALRPRSSPMAARRPPTSCSPSSSTAATRPAACAPRPCIPAASRPSSAAT